MKFILYSQINVFCIATLLLLFFKLKSGPYMRNNQRLFLWVLLSNCAFFTVDLLWVYFDNKLFSLAIPMNWALNCVYYILSGVVSICWFFYSEDLQKSQFVKNRKYSLICAIPFALLVVLALASLKTGWLFYIDEHNIYHRGPLYLLQPLFTYGYLLFSASKALVLSGHTYDYAQKMKYRTLACFVLPTLITGFVQTLVPGVPLVCMGTTFGILFVYITLQEQMISVDPLTGLNNRNELLKYLSEKVGHKSREQNTFLLMLDMDYFKQINDQYGHLEGDHALQLVADALRQSCEKRSCFVSRYGGDEFIIICELESGDSIDTLCQTIHASLTAACEGLGYKLSLSIGYAEYTPDITSYQTLISLADAKLYEAKRARGVQGR